MPPRLMLDKRLRFMSIFYRADIFLYGKGAGPLPPGGKIIILRLPVEASTFIRRRSIQIRIHPEAVGQVLFQVISFLY